MTGSGKTGLGVVPARGGAPAGRARARPRPEGRPGQPRLDLPRPRPPPSSRRGSRGATPPPSPPTWKDGPRAGWGLEARRTRPCTTRPASPSTRPGRPRGIPLNIVGVAAAARRTAPTSRPSRDEIEGYVSGLLGLVGIEADPLSSREHILLANLIEQAWVPGPGPRPRHARRPGASPPIRKLGVFDIDTFFPPDDRIDAGPASSTGCWRRRRSRRGRPGRRSTSSRLLAARRPAAAPR